MKRELRRWEIVGFIATGLFGTLLHFVYEWTGGNRVIAVFSAVNESDLGAHEAVVYPVSRVHGGGVYCVFRGVPEFLRRQGGEHPAGPCLDSGAFLHADGNVRQAP